MLQSERDVLRCFPRRQWSHLEVIPSYQPQELPSQLNDCSLGIFPSYIEAFGFGVIEMLAAALPVIAYDAPGPCDILPKKWLVQPGDVDAMRQQIEQLFDKPNSLESARKQAQKLSQRYNYQTIAQQTIDAYSV